MLDKLIEGDGTSEAIGALLKLVEKIRLVPDHNEPHYRVSRRIGCDTRNRGR
jgi:hypothetical protein